MRMWPSPNARRNATLILALAVATSGCTSHPPAPLELLNDRYGGDVAHRYASAPQDEALVLLNGAQLDGVYRLADVPAFHAASISVLRPLEARSRYGPRGKHGALLVMTKRGTSP